jgi:hypothetical protein
MIEPPQYTCCVCGARLPHLPRATFIECGSAIKRNDEQYLYFCINKHSPEEISTAITGVPKFKKAGDLKKGIADK